MALNNYGLGFEFSAKDSASAAAVGLGKQIGVLEKNVNDLNQSFEGTTNRTRDLTTGRFVKAPEGILNHDFLSKVGGSLTGISVALSGLGMTAFGALGMAAKASADFEQGITEVGTLVPHAQFSVEEMSKAVKTMMATYGGDSKTQIAALYQGISAGASDATKATALLNAANQLAIAGHTDQSTAITGLTKVLNNYNMDFSKAADVSDAFLTAVQGGLTTVGELGNAVGEVAASGKAAGISMNELIGALGTAATLTRDTAGATAGLKAALSGIAHPTADAAAEAQRLGIKFDSVTLRKKGLQQFMADITNSTKFTSDSFNKLFGSLEASNVMMALGANNMQAYNDMMSAMANKSGKGKAAFDEMNMTLDQQGAVIKANLEILAIDIGDAIKPITGFLVGLVRTVIVWFNNLGPGVKKIVAYVGIAVATFASLLGGVAGSAVAIGGLIVMGKALLISLGLVAVMVGLLVATLAPLILLAAAVYEAWTKNIGGFQTTVIIWFDRIKLAAQALMQVFSDGGFSGAVLTDLNKAENSGVKQFAINVYMWFGRIENFVKGIGAAFELGMGRVAPIIEKIVSAFQRLASHFAPVKENSKDAMSTFQKFGAAGGQVGDFLVTIIEKIATGILALLNFIDGVVEVFNGFKPALLAAWAAAKQLFGAFGELFAAFTGGKSDAQDTADTFRMLGNILGWVVEHGVMYLAFSFRILAGVVSFIGGVIGGVQTMIQGMIQGIVTGIEIIIAVLGGNWGKAWDLAKVFVIDWANTILAMLTKIVAGAAGMVDQLSALFGKDLGLKNKVSGLGSSLQQPGGALPQGPTGILPSASQNPGSSPGLAAYAPPVAPPPGAGTGQSGGPPVVNANIKTQVMIDGRQVAEANDKAKLESTGRGWGPTKSPT